MDTTITLNFTAAELEILNSALNSYSLEMMNTSKTWGDIDALLAKGRPDIWHKEAELSNAIWNRVYDAKQELKTRRA